jgi:hypothetical protein
VTVGAPPLSDMGVGATVGAPLQSVGAGATPTVGHGRQGRGAGAVGAIREWIEEYQR